MKGLIVRQPWADLILSGAKDWEMRSHGTSASGPIAIIPQGSGQVAGVVDIVAIRTRLSRDELAATEHRHCIDSAAQDEAAHGGWLVPWELAHPRTLAHPVPYTHPSGAVIWVRLADDVVAEIRAQLAENPPLAVPPRPCPQPSAAAHARKLAPPADSAIVRLTEGNLRNGHIYLRTARALFDEAHIGGSSKDDPAPRAIWVELGQSETITTDIAGDKMILRARGAVRAFLVDARAGDAVRIERVGPDRFRFVLIP